LLSIYEILIFFSSGAFVAPYQSAPLDLGTPAFYTNRKKQIDQLIDELVCQ